MERLEVTTGVFVPPGRVYEFLLDFPGYADYSAYLERVERRGDGSIGTEYHITASWWRLSRTVTSRVTDLEPPRRIDWETVEPIAASGAWHIEAAHPAEVKSPVEPPASVDDGTRVALVIRYDPTTLDGGRLDLPSFVSIGGLLDRLGPVVEREARDIVERIVADLEGNRRDVTLEVDRESAEPTEEPR